MPYIETSDSRSELPPLVVFSHLRWGFVFQRPQHLLTRLAHRFRIIFVEEPVLSTTTSGLVASEPVPGIEVLVPHTSTNAPGFHDDHLPTLEASLGAWLQERGIRNPYVWLYTPMALPLATALAPRALIYDCMDDLASFRFAPRQLVQRESALMKMADVIFTGGPSLYETRRYQHANCHCLPSAVDARHFDPDSLAPGSHEAAAAQSLHDGLSHPRLGFFGVIDERLDIELVGRLADLRPDWNIVMVGPVVKIDPATLPKRPNIRWLGMQPYAMLPHLQSHWDVCILPFALNESTRFISPTKTLEYLAGRKPVVSTPVRDVAALYGSVVRIAAGDLPFATCCEAALQEQGEEMLARREAATRLVEEYSWDATAARMGRLILEISRTPAAPVEAAPLERRRGLAVPTERVGVERRASAL